MYTLKNIADTSHLYPPPPRGRGIAGFNFSIFKALHSGAKFVVKSLLNVPAPRVNNNESEQMTEII